MSASTSNLPLLEQSPVPLPADWKDEVSARLRAHRSGRSRVPDNQPALPGMETAGPSAIAARVAERYARVPSWREAMAAEAAARAAQEAAARVAQEAAARAAAEAAASQPPLPVIDALLSEEPVAEEPPAAPRRSRSAPRKAAPQLDLSPPDVVAGSRLSENRPVETPEPYQPELIRYSVSTDSLPVPRSTPSQARAYAAALPAMQPALSDPLEEALVEPTRLLPARVIEFPRELIAPRKARPRLAEGPLLDDAPLAAEAQTQSSPDTAASPQQLRILEADPESASAAAPPRAAEQAPVWHSIQLDSEEPVRQPQAAARTALVDDTALCVARIEDRLMAGIVDIALTLAAFLVFVLVFAACTTHPPTGHTALAGAGITLLAMWVLYQFVFFSLSASTPGMRYAKIALCTFDDNNPSRTTMRVRIAALMLSALPLGLGFLWAIFDENYLSWHDRITQTYQRSYREI